MISLRSKNIGVTANHADSGIAIGEHKFSLVTPQDPQTSNVQIPSTFICNPLSCLSGLFACVTRQKEYW